MAVAEPPSPTGSRSSAISNLTIRLVSQYTGRGPNKVRTYFNDDMVTIVMRDMLTKAETTLLAKGEAGLVLTTRHTFQKLMTDELVAGVEDIMQRKVIAFLSANHVDPDMAVETFILAPEGDGETPG